MKLRIVGLLAIAAFGVTPGQLRAADLTPLIRFNGTDGANPGFGSLIADADGNLFGTTRTGGANGSGTVFEIAKTAGGYASTPTTLVSFCSLANCADGSFPVAGLFADADGNLFGTTQYGGANGGGTVFEIAKTRKPRSNSEHDSKDDRTGGYASTPTTLVSFCALANCADGAAPQSTLIADANGNLFGTTVAGGANSQGTVFEIAKTRKPRSNSEDDSEDDTAGGYASTPTILVSFCALANCADGAGPGLGLIADADGNLFGVTEFGGANGDHGTVFEITKTARGYASTPTILVSFNGFDGETPVASPIFSLIADANGNLFGTTAGGGANGGGGTVFEIAKTARGYASTPTTLVSFFCSAANCPDGSIPQGELISDANGNLFGTTARGGANDNGTVFEIAKTAGGYASTPTILVRFCSLANCADGAGPIAGLISDANGNLFGTTSSGGANDLGTVFEITGSGFVVPPIFAGTPGKPNCFGKSVSALVRQYGGLNAAAAALGYPSAKALQNAIPEFCEG